MNQNVNFLKWQSCVCPSHCAVCLGFNMLNHTLEATFSPLTSLCISWLMKVINVLFSFTLCTFVVYEPDKHCIVLLCLKSGCIMYCQHLLSYCPCCHRLWADFMDISFHVYYIDNKMTDYYLYLCFFHFANRETANIPLIALGLKETKEVDYSTLFKVQTQQLHIPSPSQHASIDRLHVEFTMKNNLWIS